VGFDTAGGSTPPFPLLPLPLALPVPLVPLAPALPAPLLVPVPLAGVGVANGNTAGGGVEVGAADRPAACGVAEEFAADAPREAAERAASTAGSTEDTSPLSASGPATELCGAGPTAAPSAMPRANIAAASAPLTLMEGRRGPDGRGGEDEGRGLLMAWLAVGPGA
jgi:hypothetical protein